MGNDTSSAVGDAFLSVGKGIAKTATSGIGALVDGVVNPAISGASFGLIPGANLGSSLAGFANSQYKRGGKVRPAAIKLKNGDYRVTHPLVGTNVLIPVGHPHHMTVARMMKQERSTSKSSIKKSMPRPKSSKKRK